jgi:peptidoglycan/xylan/chitin deacetylase (PgdA/CDA1 family)
MSYYMTMKARLYRWRRVPLSQILILAVCGLLLTNAALGARLLAPSVWRNDAHQFLHPADQTKPLKHPSALVFSKIAADQPIVDCVSRPCIALSFDDGPNRPTTSGILDILEQYQVHATFFVVGTRIATNEDLLQRMFHDGDEVGNHSWSHPDLTKLTPTEIVQQVAWTQAAVELAGVPAPALFRPPYGSLDPSLAEKLGVQIAFWNEDPRDWQTQDAAAITQAVLASAKPGGVVDMHDIYAATQQALPGILQALQQQNYQFVTVSQLLHSRSRPGNAPFYGYSTDPFAPSAISSAIAPAL